jgi:hypothetical protein
LNCLLTKLQAETNIKHTTKGTVPLSDSHILSALQQDEIRNKERSLDGKTVQVAGILLQ